MCLRLEVIVLAKKHLKILKINFQILTSEEFTNLLNLLEVEILELSDLPIEYLIRKLNTPLRAY